ncbi:MAG: DUF7344 domain-containing protein [Halorubrum sp.]
MTTRGAEKRQFREVAEADGDRTLTKTDVFDVLKNERRRAVIRYLHGHGGSATLSDIAEHIAAKENGIEIRQLSSQERKRVRIALYQCHLPRMDSLGVVDFDKHRGTVALLDPASEMLYHLQLPPDGDRRTESTERLAFAFVVAVAALVTAGTLGLGPLSAVPPAGWTAVSVVALVGVTGRQWRRG